MVENAYCEMLLTDC